MNAHKRFEQHVSPHWTGLALRGEEWKAAFSRYEKILDRRNGCALGIADLCDLGRYPIQGKLLRRFRRLDRMTKAMYKRLYSHPLRAESPPLGGIDG